MSEDAEDRPPEGRFVGRTHRLALRVYFEDTDAAGIVYHANYLRFMERGRTDMMRALGIDHAAAMRAGEGVYAVAEAHLKYRRPALLGDALVVVSTVEGLTAATTTIQQRVMRGDELIAEATIIAAFLSPDRRPRRQPRAWLEKFRPYARGEETA